MRGKMEQAKGRAKQAAGVMTGDKRLEREGKIQRATGELQEKAEEFADDAKKTAAKIAEKVKSALKG